MENGEAAKVEAEVIEVPLEKIVPLEQQEIDIQIATARQFPRSLQKFRTEALTAATMDEETAASCFYVLPRGGKKIEGPGVRLAEIVANAWGNLRMGSRIVGQTDDGKYIIGEGHVHDLQTNNRVALRVLRRITDKYGKRYNDDMIGMTGNAACSIALRNAIFKIIPMAYVQTIYQSAKRLAVGDATSLNDRRQKMVEHFGKFGISLERLLQRVEKPSIEDVGLEEIELLIGLATSIKDGDVNIDVAFPVKVEPVNGEKPTTLAEKVKSKTTAGKIKPKEEKK